MKGSSLVPRPLLASYRQHVVPHLRSSRGLGIPLRQLSATRRLPPPPTPLWKLCTLVCVTEIVLKSFCIIIKNREKSNLKENKNSLPIWNLQAQSCLWTSRIYNGPHAPSRAQLGKNHDFVFNVICQNVYSDEDNLNSLMGSLFNKFHSVC